MPRQGTYETRPAVSAPAPAPAPSDTVDVELIGGAVKWRGRRHERGAALSLPRDLADHLVAIGEARVRHAS